MEFYSYNGSIFDDQAIVIALKHFKRQGIDAILHCGDVTSKGDSPLELLTYRGWCLHTILRLLNCSTVKLANLLFARECSSVLVEGLDFC